jgi:hypothetical protein
MRKQAVDLAALMVQNFTGSSFRFRSQKVIAAQLKTLEKQ